MKRILRSTEFAVTGYLLFAVFLFLYSFTQIDLSLTLSGATVLQEIQQAFQHIGYFNRPVSAQLFLFIILGMFLFFLLLQQRIREKKIPARFLWYIAGGVTFLFVFAYNAFSYDLFNYIFDAKIVTYYQENPYLKKALDYPGDPMLSFMHWTHRVYPYGPLWLGLTVPLSYLGLQKFILTFFLFKLFMAGSFLATGYFIYRILQKISPEHAMLGAAVFLLNPYVLIESVISAHNDIVMLFFAVAAIYLLVIKKTIPAYAVLILSIAIKYATVFLAPAFMYVSFLRHRKKSIPWEKIWLYMLAGMVLAVIGATLRTNFQPWYLLYLIPISALLSYRNYIHYPFVILSVTALMNYVPFLAAGNWDPPIPEYLMLINTVGIITSVAVGVFMYVKEKT